jgi:hypothetical protein
MSEADLQCASLSYEVDLSCVVEKSLTNKEHHSLHSFHFLVCSNATSSSSEWSLPISLGQSEVPHLFYEFSMFPVFLFARIQHLRLYYV